MYDPSERDIAIIIEALRLANDNDRSYMSTHNTSDFTNYDRELLGYIKERQAIIEVLGVLQAFRAAE